MASGFWSYLTYAVVEVKRWPEGHMRWSTEAPLAKFNRSKVAWESSNLWVFLIKKDRAQRVCLKRCPYKWETF